MIPDNRTDPFRDRNGRWLTQALFPETSNDDKFLVYRLKDGISDKFNHLPCLKHLYLDCMDYTEYKFANKYLGGWEHWQRLCQNAVIGREVDKWRDELEVKLVAEGLKQITDIAIDPDNKGRLTAAKFLAEKGFKPKRTAGRPTKDEVSREAKIAAGVTDKVSSDLERIRKLQ